MENVVNNNAVNMQAAAGEKKKNDRSKKKKKSRPKLRPVDTLPAVDEDNLDLESGLGYGDIMVVPPPTPRDKLLSDLHRHEKELNSLPKFTDEWFQLKQEVALAQMKLDEWDNNTPTAARMETPIVTTSAAYQDIVKSISFKEQELQHQQQSSEAKSEEQQQEAVQPNKTKKKKKSSRKNRPKLKPQSVEKKLEEGDEEDGLGFNDILLTKTTKPQVVDENTALLIMDQVVNTEIAPQSQDGVPSNVIGDWLLRGVIGTLFCVVAFKFLLS